MSIDTKTLKPGDKLYICRPGGSWDDTYYEAAVLKVTPAGLVDVQIGRGTARFGADGYEHTIGSKYQRERLDDMPFEKRAANLAEESRAKEAAKAINEIVHLSGVNYRWSKARLNEEITRLRTLIEEAARKVEAI